MKRLLAGLALVVAAATLSGCYYDPGYSYVRSTGYGGDAYYGRAAPVYDGGYYVAPGYYDGYYGCCYAPGVSVGISGVWYGGSRYRHGGYDGYRGRGHWQHGSRGRADGHGGRRGGDHRGRRDDRSR